MWLVLSETPMFLFESIATLLDKRIKKMVEAALTDRLREVLPDELEPYFEKVFQVIQAEKAEATARIEAMTAQIEDQAEEIRNFRSQAESGLSRDAFVEVLTAIEQGVEAIIQEPEVPSTEEPTEEEETEGNPDPINGAVEEDGTVGF